MNQPPPRRQRKPLREREQQFAPVNVVMALIGQSRRRCAAYAEMMEKQGMGLVQLHMECQQMAGVIRSDPQGLNRLAISLHAARAALEKNKAHLEEQIQVELFLQGEFERWLRGEPPIDFAPPPPGMTRQHVPPQMMPFPQLATGLRESHEDYGDEYDGERGDERPRDASPPSRRPRDASPPSRYFAPKAPPPPPPPPRLASSKVEPVMPPQAAFAAYQQKPVAQSKDASSRIAQQPQQPPTRMPVVRLPVQHYAPASETAQTNGGTTSSAIPLAEDEKTEGDQGTSSTSS